VPGSEVLCSRVFAHIPTLPGLLRTEVLTGGDTGGKPV